MRVAFVIVSVSDRVKELNNLVESIMRQRKFDSYDLCLCYQDYRGTYIITERKTERVYFHIRVINADTAHHITLLEEYANKRNGTTALTADAK